MTDDVWKVHHIRDKTVVAIYVFSGGNESGSATGTEVALASNTGEPLLREKEARRLFDVSREELFTEEELEFIQTNRIPIRTVASRLYMDDTIRTIKLKIASSMTTTAATTTANPSVETMYLFGTRPSLYTVAQHIQSASSPDTDPPMRRDTMIQLLYNLGVDTNVIDRIVIRDTYTAQDMLDILPSDVLQSMATLSVPLGHQFERQSDPMFVANPYVIRDVTDSAYTPTTKNPFYYFDTHLLLNYTPLTDRDLYLCLADEVYTHAFREFTHREKVDDTYLTNLYFPLLASIGILDSTALQQKQRELDTATRSILDSPEYTFIQESVDLFYSVSDRRKDTDRCGIQSISFVLAKDPGLKGMNSPRQIPLEAIFKTIHATAIYPWIVYNPGPGRDNQIRLFATQTAKNGQLIPVVPESALTRLKRDMGRVHTMGVYLILSPTIEVYVELNLTGSMRIRCPVLKKSISIKEFDHLLRTPLQTLIDHIHAFIQPIGYELPQFVDMSSPNVQIQQIKYVADIELGQMKPFRKLTKSLPCIQSVFDIYEESIDATNGISMRFKRVELFRKMDAMNALMQDVMTRRQIPPSPKVIVEILQKYYPELSGNDALKIVTEFLVETEVEAAAPVSSKKTQIHAGFLVKMQKSSTNHLLIEVSGIHRIDYLNTIQSFLNGMVYLTQNLSKKCPAAPRRKMPVSEVPIAIAAASIESETLQMGMAIAEHAGPAIQSLQFGTEVEEDEDAEEEVEAEAEAEDDYFGLEEFVEEDEEDEEDLPVVKGGQEPEEEEEEEEEDMPGFEKTRNYFLERMKSRDAPLFLSERQGKYDSYSRLCAANMQRQPVILTEAEKSQIDLEHPGSYTHALKHGSDPKNPYWYICPRYWSIKTNSSLTEAEATSGTYGDIMPNDAKKRIPGKKYLIYEFDTTNQHRDDKNQYIHNTPGFLKPDSHPKGLCVPCCFKSAWDKKDQAKRRDTCAKQQLVQGQEQGKGTEETQGQEQGKGTEEVEAQGQGKGKGQGKGTEEKETPTQGKGKGTAPKIKYQMYVLDMLKYPLPPKRLGVPPLIVQRMMGFDVINTLSPTNSALIQPNVSTILRYGVELDATQTQSILGIVCELYAYKQNRLHAVPSLTEMRTILTNGNTITLDRFVQYHHGSLVSVFRPKTYDPDELGDVATKYQDSRLYQSIDPADENQMDFLEESIAAYEQFLKFLSNTQNPINHTYLWDMITEDNPLLMSGGFNMILLDMPENDITDNIELICPTNAKEPRMDPTRETVVILHRENIYEPLYMYEERDRVVHITRTFLPQGGHTIKNPALRAMQRIIHMLEKTSQQQCAALPSQPSVYRFLRNIDVERATQYAKDARYTVLHTVRNYKGMGIGIVVSPPEIDTKTGTKTGTKNNRIVMIPTSPSVIDLSSSSPNQVVFFDDAEAPLWSNYRNTTTRLRRVHDDTGKQIPCLPVLKVVEDGLVVGVLTQTNQMVRIDPPEPVDHSDIIDGPTTKLPVFSTTGSVPCRGDAYSADKQATSIHTAPPNPERTQMVQRIAIETRMYQQFRMVIKQQLQRFEHRRRRQHLHEILAESTTVDAITFRARIVQLRTIMEELMAGHIEFQDMTNVTDMQKQSQKQCMMSNNNKHKDDECIIVLPIRHLVTNVDNRISYPIRISDELLRYRRIRLFLLDPNYYLNLATVSSTAYDIADDEILVLEPALTPEFFRNLVPLSAPGNRTNYDTAIPAAGTSEKYIQRLTTEQQREMLAPTQAPILITGMQQCILKIHNMTGGTHGTWKQSFPSTTREIDFNLSSPQCLFSPIVYVLQSQSKQSKQQQQPYETMIRDALIAGYSRRIEEHEDKIRQILTTQGKSAAAIAKNVPLVPLIDLVSDPNYYLTDLDLWIVCQELKLPVVLFSSTKLKHMVDKKWLYLGTTVPTVTTPLFFLRSPPNVLNNTLPKYSILEAPYAYGQLKSVGDELQQGFANRTDNVQSLDEFLHSFKITRR